MMTESSYGVQNLVMVTLCILQIFCQTELVLSFGHVMKLLHMVYHWLTLKTEVLFFIMTAQRIQDAAVQEMYMQEIKVQNSGVPLQMTFITDMEIQ